METSENETFLNYIQTTVMASKKPQEFFDINTVSIPNKTEVKERCKYNFDKYRGNYIILLGLFILFFVILNPIILPLLVIWGLYFFFVNKGEQTMTVRGYVIQTDWLWKGILIFSVLFVICVYWVFVSMLATSSLFVLVVFSHMLLFHRKDEEPEI